MTIQGVWQRWIDIHIGMNRRRVTGRSNTAASRGPMPGGSTSSMMRIYSDDSPGLRVYVKTRALSISKCN